MTDTKPRPKFKFVRSVAEIDRRRKGRYVIQERQDPQTPFWVFKYVSRPLPHLLFVKALKTEGQARKWVDDQLK